PRPAPAPGALLAGLLAGGLAACAGGGDEPCDPEAPGTICTIAGECTNGYGGDGGPALEARLALPGDMDVAPSGEPWVIDFNNSLVRATDADGVIRTVIGTGLVGDSPLEVDGELRSPALASSFNHTPDLLFHDGWAYLAAWHNSRLKRVELATMMVEN